jgi:hypothetical protein
VAKLAFDSLRRHEQTRLRDETGTTDDENKVEREMLLRARNSAREAMKTDQTFLGGTKERGMALRTPDWEHTMACYLCASMMGYKDTKVWPEDHEQTAFAKFR